MKYLIALLAVLSLTACASKPPQYQQQNQQPMTYMPQPSVIVIQSQPTPQYVMQAMPQVHYVMPTYQQQYQQPKMVPNPAYVQEQ